MLSDLLDGQPSGDVTVQHGAHEVDAALAHDPWHAQLVVEDLVDAVKGVFLVDECVKQDPQRPHVLLPTAVGFALEDFRSGVICFSKS